VFGSHKCLTTVEKSGAGATTSGGTGAGFNVVAPISLAEKLVDKAIDEGG
jgi:hypothetical protein